MAISKAITGVTNGMRQKQRPAGPAKTGTQKTALKQSKAKELPTPAAKEPQGDMWSAYQKAKKNKGAAR